MPDNDPASRKCQIKIVIESMSSKARSGLVRGLRASFKGLRWTIRVALTYVFWTAVLTLGAALLYVFIEDVFKLSLAIRCPLPGWWPITALWLVNHAEPIALLLAIAIAVWEYRQNRIEASLENLEAWIPGTDNQDSITVHIRYLRQLRNLKQRARRELWPEYARLRVNELCKDYLNQRGCDQLLRLLGHLAIREQGSAEGITRALELLAAKEFEGFHETAASNDFRRLREVLTETEPGNTPKFSATGFDKSMARLWQAYSGNVFELLVQSIYVLLERRDLHDMDSLANEFKRVRSALRHPKTSSLVRHYPQSVKFITSRRPQFSYFRDPKPLPSNLHDWLEKKELEHPLFGTENPSEDILLEKTWIDPNNWDQFFESRGVLAIVPTVVDGRLIALHYCQNKINRFFTYHEFPVQMPLPGRIARRPSASDNIETLNSVARAFAKTWLQWLASNPEIFQELGEKEQVDVAELLGREFSLKEIEVRIQALAALSWQEHLGKTGKEPKEVHIKWLLWKVHSILNTPHLRFSDPSVAVCRCASVRPYGFDRVSLVVSAWDERDRKTVQNLVRMTPVFQHYGLDVKVLWPRSAGELTVTAAIPTTYLDWTPDTLEEILANRFKKASSPGKGFISLFDVPPASSERMDFYNLQGRFARTTEPSLAQLLCAGRKLIERHLAKLPSTEFIDIELFEDLVAELEGEKP